MKLIILDRDGVINQDSEDYIKSPEEWIPIPGSLQAIADLNQSGYRVVIATNQSGLARGLFDIDALNAIHRKMQNELNTIGGHIDGIFFCPHGPKARCNCRKPKPGLLLQASQRFFSDTTGILSIGDSLRDLQAAENYGVKHILVLTGNGIKTENEIPHRKDIPTYDDLSNAVQDLLNN
jgi:D-glycero-D-manno-heptose 1,7-bisphosphate phosphatase